MASQAYLDLLAAAGRQPTDLGTQDRSLVQQAQKTNYAQHQPGFSPSNLVHSAVGVTGAAAGAIGHAAVDGFTGLFSGTKANLKLASEGSPLVAQDKQISDKQNQLEKAYKDGSITKDQYKQGYKDLLDSSSANITAHDKFTKDTQKNYYGAGQTATDYAKAAGTILTVAAPFATAGAGALAAVPGAEKVAGAVDATLAAGKGNVIGKLARNALITQPTVSTPNTVVKDVQTKNYGDLALQAGLLAAPSALKKFGPGIAETAKTALFGKEGSVINGLKFADGTVSDVLSTLSGNAQKKYTALAKIVQQRMIDEGRSAKQVAKYYSDGNAIGKQTVTQFLDQAAKHIGAEKAIIKDTKAGLTGLAPSAGQTVIASRWDASARKATVEHLLAGGDVNELIDNGTIPKNPNLIAEIKSKISSGDIKDINKIFAASPVSKSPSLDALMAETGGSKSYQGGYVPAIGAKGSANYQTLSKTGELVASKSALPGLDKVGKLVTKAGLSPVAGTPGALQGAIKDNLKTELTKLDPTISSKTSSLYTGLLNKAGDTRGVTDIRTLSNRAIGQVLRDEGVTSISPRQLKAALVNAQLHVPAALQSAGGKLTSAAIKYIPGEKTYLKVQSYGRFGVNPVFASKVGIKSAYLGAIDSSGGRIAGPVSKDVAEYVGNSDMVKSLGGTAEDVLGTPGAKATGQFGVNKIQQNIAGNLVQNILKKNGAALEDIAKNPELKQQVDHAVQMIYGYPKGGFLDSNLAKSLNVAVFPARFEAKVLGATAKAIINQPPVARAMILNGLLKAQNFLNSPQGQQWKKDNSELVDVAKYFTPLDTVEKVMNAVTGHGDIGIKDLGAIGGLPFGVFTQILTDQGVDLGPIGSSPYVPTKTGVAIGKQIPETTKAKLATALGDIISQSFSYPGAALGLPSKASIVKNSVGTLSGGALTTKASEFKTVGGPAPASTAPKTIPTIKPYKAPVTKAPNITPFIKTPKAKRPKTLAKRIGQPF